MRVASIIEKKDRIFLSLFFALLGWMLANGFSNTALLFSRFFIEFLNSFFSISLSETTLLYSGWIGLSFLFYFSTFSFKPRTHFSIEWCPLPRFSFPLALFLALVYGLFLGIFQSSNTPAPQDLLWLLLVTPVSEEFLFRGWVWGISSQMSKAEFFSFTCPIPAPAVWTSVCFSLWHVQSLAFLPTSLVLFQMCYTFFTSIWLCRLRQKPGGIAYCIVTHAGLNAMTLIGQCIL